MFNIANALSYLPKRFTGLFGILLASIFTLSTLAAPAVMIESAIGVANVTDGDTEYTSSVNADYEDVVKVQLWYHNMEEADSGKIAEDLTAKFNVPTAAGKTQKITGTVGGSNTNSVTSTATINLDRDDAYLEYVPGSAKWRHNAGTNEAVNYQTVDVNDSIVTSGAGLVLEDAKPCFNFEATVTILVRVRVPSLSIQKDVSKVGVDDGYNQSITSMPGDKVEYAFVVTNNGNATLNNVIIGDVLPKGVTFIQDSTIMTSSAFPDGNEIAGSGIVSGGLNLGTFTPGAVVYVSFLVTVDPIDSFDCGTNTIVNKGVVKADTVSIRTDTADVVVKKECEAEKFSYECSALNLVATDRKVTASAVIAKSDNVTLKSVSIDFGDGTVVPNNNAEHTYTKDGLFKVVATVVFTVDGVDKTVTCEGAVEFKPNTPPVTPPTKELPKTGAGDFLLALFGTGTAAAAAKGYVDSRRALKVTL